MGALLVVAFIATVLFVCGLIILFSGGGSSNNRAGMAMVTIAIVLGILCIIFQPKGQYVPAATWSNTN